MASRSSLLPREHGAYAELAFPLLTGVALGAPSLPVLALASAAVAFFLANEPVAILLGARGGRIKDQQGQRAKRRGLVLIGAGILLGGVGLLGAAASIWPDAAPGQRDCNSPSWFVQAQSWLLQRLVR